MRVGSFGSVSFTVSAATVETFENMKWTSTANYSTHKVHGQQAILECTGFDSDKLTFDMTLSAFFGVNPLREVEKLNAIMRSKTGYALVLGTTVIGSRWVLTNISREFDHVFADGSLVSVKVQVTLREQG